MSNHIKRKTVLKTQQQRDNAKIRKATKEEIRQKEFEERRELIKEKIWKDEIIFLTLVVLFCLLSGYVLGWYFHLGG